MNEQLEDLYHQLLKAWNERDATSYARLFSKEGAIVGFDGSTANSQQEIEGHLKPIFKDHPTATYVGKVRAIREIGSDTALVRAVAGMIPPGKSALMPERNCIQTLVASRQPSSGWRIEMFQNTPARLDGRPEEVDKLTRELEAELEPST